MPFATREFLHNRILSFCGKITWLLNNVAGIKIEFRGLEKLPPPPFIIAPKHQSQADGLVMLAHFQNIAYVIGGAVENYPFVGQILEKSGAMIVDMGGRRKRGKRIREASPQHIAALRNLMIFPEGGLIRLEERVRLKPGVCKFQETTNWPIVPIATNSGLFWAAEDFKKEKGTIIYEILDPIEAGQSRTETLEKLGKALFDNSKRLIDEAVAINPNLSQANSIWPTEINHISRYDN